MLRMLDVRYKRDSAFSYTCRACSRCCHDKIIQLNPYEVARLAQNRGISTTEFLARYTERSGTALRRVEKGACIFLTPQGCAVHFDRSLVCRLYPLGRHVTSERGEEFREVQPHPETEGEYDANSTVQAFLDRQDAGPFIEAADAYAELVGRLSHALCEQVEDHARFTDDMQAALAESGEEEQGSHVPDWLDMDRTVERFCTEQRLPFPRNMTEKMPVHIRAMETGLLGQPDTRKEE